MNGTTSTELFTKHFGEESVAVDLSHPNMAKFFDELSVECLNDNLDECIAKLKEIGYNVSIKKSRGKTFVTWSNYEHFAQAYYNDIHSFENVVIKIRETIQNILHRKQKNDISQNRRW